MKRILYLDADLLNKSIFKCLVENSSEKIEVTALSSTLSGEDALRNNSYDLIISQIYPAKMIDGFNIIKSLRLGCYGNDNRSIPAIAHTTINLTDTPQECLKAGFDAFVPMPDTEHILLGEIKRLFDINTIDESDNDTSEKVFCLNYETSDIDRDLIKIILKKEYGRRIFLFQANSLNAAEEVIQKMIIDFVICDGAGAVSFVKNLRDGIYGHNKQNMTAIVCTAYANVGDKEEFMRQGFSAYIAKPINKREFIKTVNNYVPALKISSFN